MSANAPLALSEIQKRFRDAVLGADNTALTSVTTAPGDIAARIAVHRATVQGSLIEVLATTFPVVKRVIGDSFFKGLAGRFVVATPPSVPQLSAYGAAFADFIAQEDVGRRLPYLADTARLEWARNEAYFAADAPPFNPADLAALSPDAMARVVLRLHPATRLVTSPFPIHRIWEVNQPQITNIPQIDMRVGQAALVSRKGYQVLTRALTPPNAAFVATLAAGKNLREAADVALKSDGAFGLQAALQAHFITDTFRD